MTVVGGSGSFALRLSVPGGTVPCAGVTVVGVQTTHRRQGILSRMIDAQLRDVRDRGEPIAALWASQETIYGRFGFGMASMIYRMRLPHHAAAIGGVRASGVTARLVDETEALRVFPRIYARSVGRVPGLLDRPDEWWRLRSLDDGRSARRGAGPLQRLLVERERRAVGYALYRISQETVGGTWTKTLRVVEAFGIDDAALLEVWRYLLAVDWMETIEAWMLPLDHPLVLSLARVNLAELTLFDGVWVRPLDVGAALSARSYAGDGRVRIEVTDDPHFPDNVGVWQVEPGSVRQVRTRPDLRLPVASLGSAYLGGFSFADLVRAGLAEETVRGGAARGDALFRSERAPVCAEIF